MAKHNDAGERFEREVAQMYRAAGYGVEQNVQLGGKEFDLVVTMASFGGMDVRIAVECKYRSNGQVGSADVNDFIAAFEASRHPHNLTFAVMVSNVRFARLAQVAALSHNQVRLMSRHALDDELLGARVFLENAPASYRTDASNYILLSATSHDGMGVRTGDVAATCVERLAGRQPSFTLLLGDFGSGKTTIAERTHRELCELYLAGKTTSFPVLLYLRTLDQSDSENNFIDQHLKPISSQLGIAELEKLRRRGGLTFILDGYDEVATNAGEDARLRLSSRVMRLINRADRVLLTSRPTYFSSIAELNDLVGQLIERDFVPPEDLRRPSRRQDSAAHARLREQYETVRLEIAGPGYRSFSAEEGVTYYIDPLTPDDIIAYFEPHSSMLKRQFGMTPAQVYEILSGIYDLTDLLTRPLLLKMFVTLLEKEKFDLRTGSSELGPAAIYTLYVNLHLDREWNLRKFLRSDERRAFARTLAIAILEAGGSLEATYESLSAIVRTGGDVFAPARQHFLDVALADVVTDVRICAFINMTPNGRLEFSHKSFMEFFVAEVILTEILSRRKVPVLNRDLNYEILYFLGSFCVTWSDYIVSMMNHLRDFGYSESPVYRNNLKVALLLCERASRDREYREIDFSGIRFGKRRFDTCGFENVALRNGQFIELRFAECTFDNLVLEGEGERLVFEACGGLLSLPAVLNRLIFTECRDLHLHPGEYGRQFATDVELSTSHVALLAGEFRWTEITALHARIYLEVDTKLTITDGSLQDVDFGGDRARPPLIELERCQLKDISFGLIQISKMAFADRSTSFRRCRGLLLVSDPHRDLHGFQGKGKDGVTRYRGFLVEKELGFIQLEMYNRMAAADQSALARCSDAVDEAIISKICEAYLSDPGSAR